jgi:hypothetical protein
MRKHWQWAGITAGRLRTTTPNAADRCTMFAGSSNSLILEGAQAALSGIVLAEEDSLRRQPGAGPQNLQAEDAEGISQCDCVDGGSRRQDLPIPLFRGLPFNVYRVLPSVDVPKITARAFGTPKVEALYIGPPTDFHTTGRFFVQKVETDRD